MRILLPSIQSRRQEIQVITLLAEETTQTLLDLGLIALLNVILYVLNLLIGYPIVFKHAHQVKVRLPQIEALNIGWTIAILVLLPDTLAKCVVLPTVEVLTVLFSLDLYPCGLHFNLASVADIREALPLVEVPTLSVVTVASHA